LSFALVKLPPGIHNDRMGEKPLGIDEELTRATAIGGAPPPGGGSSPPPYDSSPPPNDDDTPPPAAKDGEPEKGVTAHGPDGSTFTYEHLQPDVNVMERVDETDDSELKKP